MLAANQFDIGSLVLVDDTLDVDGGETANLRVRLGARPRSNVTVALSETSALISLGAASLTFTPDNWDTFQSVTVTGAGNRQAFAFPASGYSFGTDQKGWNVHGSGLQINAALLHQAGTVFLATFQVFDDGRVRLLLSPTDTGGVPDTSEDLTDAVETSGAISIEAGSDSLTVLIAGADVTEPYLWTPSNSAEVISFHSALPNTNASQAGTFTLRDYTPGDATISLAASGPTEYSGVTGSATVSVN